MFAEHQGFPSHHGRLPSLPIIGRDREIERLQREIADVRAGSPRVLLVSGEAGIGKSRLLSEAMSLFAREGGIVALGRCVDETGMPPFLPWIDIGASLSGLTGGSIADLLLEPTESDSGNQHSNPETRRIRLYGTVCSMLADLAAEQPLLLAFDDLQWSDPASNQLLRYVIAHLSTSRLLVAGAFRPLEARENAELNKTLVDVDRERRLTRISLGALANQAAESLINGLLGPVSPDVLSSIRDLSGANPFAIEEIARTMAEPGDQAAIPDGISAVIARRFEARTPGCQAVLELAAIGGRDISVELVASALERDSERIVADLEEAASAALVVPNPESDSPFAPDYAFAHDRIRETLVANIPLARRRLLHDRIAAALERSSTATAGDLARLAHHLGAARRTDRAATVYEQLGDADLAIGAYDDAAIAFERAGELRQPVSGDLLVKLGDARLHAGRPDAVDAYTAAERVFLDAGDAAGVARSLQRLGTAHARREEHEIAVASLHASVAAWSKIADASAELIATWTELCTVLGTSLGRYDEAMEAGRLALTAASRPGTRPDLEARARYALATTQIRSGDLEPGRRLLEPALALALQARQSELAAEIAGTLANYSYWTGDLPSSERFARWRRELGIESKDPYALRHTLPWLAIVAMARGQWDTALHSIAEAEADLARVDSPEPRAFLKQLSGMIALQRGQPERAVDLLEEAVAGFRAIGQGTLPWYLGVLASAYFAAGEQSKMERTVSETAALVAHSPAGTLPRAPSIAQLGMIAAQTSDRAAMRRWQAELQPYRGQFHWVLMDRALGMMAAGLGEQAAAGRHLASAIETASRGQIQPELLLARAERALLTGAMDELTTIGTEMRAIDLAVSGRYRVAGAAPAGAIPAGLTGREVEVIVLVAQGKTNRDIAALLSISEKTVTNHLTHIFTKAKLDNRAGAVAFALRHRLLD